MSGDLRAIPTRTTINEILNYASCSRLRIEAMKITHHDTPWGAVEQATWRLVEEHSDSIQAATHVATNKVIWPAAAPITNAHVGYAALQAAIFSEEGSDVYRS